MHGRLNYLKLGYLRKRWEIVEYSAMAKISKGKKRVTYAWALKPIKSKLVSQVSDYGFELYKKKSTALEKASPLFKVVKMRLTEVD